MSASPSILVEHVSKRFDQRLALNDVSFTYQGTRAVGYLGPNGAGKTTTLKLLTGLLQPTAGRLLVDGIDASRDTREALNHLGALIETPEPYPTLTCREAIEMAGAFRGVPAEEISAGIQQYAELLDLPPLDTRTGKLSKGQRQRVVIAGTLVGDPPILILDEPTSGLDPAERVRVRNIILELKKDRLVLMSSHLLGEVTDTCDDVIFINEGRLLWQGTVEEVEAQFRVRKIDVEFASSVALEQFRPLGSLATSLEPLSDRRFRIGFDGTDPTRVRLLGLLMQVGPVLSYAPSGSALEDMYVQLLDPRSMAPPPPPPPTGPGSPPAR